MHLDQLKPNVIVRGPMLPEPVQIIVTIPVGASVRLAGKGLNTGQVHEQRRIESAGKEIDLQLALVSESLAAKAIRKGIVTAEPQLCTKDR